MERRRRLHVVGRKADTIVTGGENVAPAEVEAVLEAHPAVAEAAVHGAPTASGARRSWRPSSCAPDVSRGASCARTARRLASFKVPKAIAFADALPRTRSGKLVRSRL